MYIDKLVICFRDVLQATASFTAVVAGPTGCGKSTWVLRLVENARQMIVPPPSRIYYCYGEYQPIFNKYTQVQFHEGLPELSNEVFNGREPTLVVVDDLMSETNQLQTFSPNFRIVAILAYCT